MAIWVKCKAIHYGEKNGQRVTYYPGDWVRVSRSQAIYMQNEGIAEIPENTIYKDLNFDKCGVALLNGKLLTLPPGYPRLIPHRNVDAPCVPFDFTVLWNPNTKANVGLFSAGLHLLDKWEVLIPISSYETLASDIVGKKDEEWANEFLPDLRVPVFNIDLLFLKKCSATDLLINLWNKGVNEGHSSEISLLCAVYRSLPLLLALPIVWTDVNYD